MIDYLNGKKTYISAIAMLLYAAGGYLSGNLDANTAAEFVMGALAVFGLRHAVAKQSSVES